MILWVSSSIREVCSVWLQTNRKKSLKGLQGNSKTNTALCTDTIIIAINVNRFDSSGFKTWSKLLRQWNKKITVPPTRNWTRSCMNLSIDGNFSPCDFWLHLFFHTLISLLNALWTQSRLCWDTGLHSDSLFLVSLAKISTTEPPSCFGGVLYLFKAHHLFPQWAHSRLYQFLPLISVVYLQNKMIVALSFFNLHNHLRGRVLAWLACLRCLTQDNGILKHTVFSLWSVSICTQWQGN